MLCISHIGYNCVINRPLYFFFTLIAYFDTFRYFPSLFAWWYKYSFHLQVAVRSAFLGLIFSVGLFVADLAPPSYHVLGWYMCFMSFFHYSEFLMIALTNPRTLSLDSFILNHSVEYGVAAVASWTEFLIERWYCPGNPSEYSLVSIVVRLSPY